MKNNFEIEETLIVTKIKTKEKHKVIYSTHNAT